MTLLLCAPAAPLLLPPVAHGRPTLDVVHHCDLFALCGVLPDQSVDMILADLPYGTTACEWDTVIPFEPLWVAFKRVIKPRGAIVLTASQPFTSRLVMSNLAMFKYSWVWKKTKPSDHIRSKLKPLSAHEDVLIFSPGTIANCSNNLMAYYPQGTRPTSKRHYRPDICKAGTTLGYQRPSWKNEWIVETENYPQTVIEFANPNNYGDHPTQKPVALFDYLIRTYTRPGEVVLDPVCGSGTTAIAARNTGRHFICGDILAKYVDAARERLAQPYTPPLFAAPPSGPEPVQAPLFDI